ncbi:MAG: hypothetical protein ACLT1X_07350 [Christensenellales bacterium]
MVQSPAYDAGGNIYRYYAKSRPLGSGWQLATGHRTPRTAPIPANSENRVFQITNDTQYLRCPRRAAYRHTAVRRAVCC